MSQVASAAKYEFNDRTKYDALMDVIRNRITTRAFDPAYVVPREHYDMILEAARQSHAVITRSRDLANRLSRDAPSSAETSSIPFS